jgi:hypothetical protein
MYTSWGIYALLPMQQCPRSLGLAGYIPRPKCWNEINGIRALLDAMRPDPQHTVWESSVVAIDTINTIRLRRALQLLAVQLASASSETLCSLLRSDVALRLGKHLVADLELTDRSAPEQRWEEVDVEVTALDLFRRASQGRLMYTHA